MPVLYTAGGILLLYLALSCAAAVYCLKRLCVPVRFDEAHERQRELDHGFGDALALWDTVWQREPFSLDSGGVTLRGERITNPTPAPGRTRAAIICHGQTVNRIACLKYAKIFLDEGFHVLVFDERYFGESSASHSTMGQEEGKDIALLAQYARSLYGEDCILALQGESMGAASSLMALKYTKADLVLEDCPFAETVTMAREQVFRMVHLPPFPVIPLAVWLGKRKFGYDALSVNPIEAVAQTDAPICFMHGDGDRLIDCSHSERMFARCKNPASELHLFPGSRHACSIVDHREEYEAVARTFIRKILAGTGEPLS